MMDALIENAMNTPSLTIDVGSAHDLIEAESPLVVDVREPDEFIGGHIPGGANMPLGEMHFFVSQLPQEREAPILVVCQTGVRSLSGALFLASLGYGNVRSITGGTKAWQEAGFKIESG